MSPSGKQKKGKGQKGQGKNAYNLSIIVIQYPRYRTSVGITLKSTHVPLWWNSRHSPNVHEDHSCRYQEGKVGLPLEDSHGLKTKVMDASYMLH